MDPPNANETESFLKQEQNNVFKKEKNSAKNDWNSNISSRSFGKLLKLDDVDIAYIDHEETDDENLELQNVFSNSNDRDEDEPDMMLHSRIMTPLPPEVDINAYQHKKTLAQGMMDLALLLANANQLRYVLESKSIHPYYIANIILLAISISLQIFVGIALIVNSQYCVKNEKEMRIANRVNNFTLIGVFIITIVNVFISAFGIADSSQ